MIHQLNHRVYAGIQCIGDWWRNIKGCCNCMNKVGERIWEDEEQNNKDLNPCSIGIDIEITTYIQQSKKQHY